RSGGWRRSIRGTRRRPRGSRVRRRSPDWETRSRRPRDTIRERRARRARGRCRTGRGSGHGRRGRPRRAAATGRGPVRPPTVGRPRPAGPWSRTCCTGWLWPPRPRGGDDRSPRPGCRRSRTDGWPWPEAAPAARAWSTVYASHNTDYRPVGEMTRGRCRRRRHRPRPRPVCLSGGRLFAGRRLIGRAALIALEELAGLLPGRVGVLGELAVGALVERIGGLLGHLVDLVRVLTCNVLDLVHESHV